MIGNTYNWQLTNYPEIYKKVIWGQDTPTNNSQIIENRNSLIIEYNIKKFIDKYKFPKKIIDILNNFVDENNYEHDCVCCKPIQPFFHVECYYTQNKKYILIIVLKNINYDFIDKFEKQNFVSCNLYDRMYSYIKVI
jgi:hypothetical protein